MKLKLAELTEGALAVVALALAVGAWLVLFHFLRKPLPLPRSTPWIIGDSIVMAEYSTIILSFYGLIRVANVAYERIIRSALWRKAFPVAE